MIEVSVVIPALNEEKNVEVIIPAILDEISKAVEGLEIIIVDGGSKDRTQEVASELGAKVIRQKERGYGGALISGFSEAKGKYILTMDADLSHKPVFFHDMYFRIKSCEVVIASRYIQGGNATMPWFRRMLSLVLNQFFRRGLSLPIMDISSGFRLYRADAVRDIKLGSRDFDVLEEILLRLYINGYTIKETPFDYHPRIEGKSHAKLIKFGIAYLKTFFRMWKLRNSTVSADHEERAYYSKFPLQRWWQRKRAKIIRKFASGSKISLDVGCGSSPKISSLPNPVGMDLRLNKLFFMRKHGFPLVCGGAEKLPFKDSSFDCVICSKIIEYLESDSDIFAEITRVLCPGGRLIIATPDYSRSTWIAIERIYRMIFPKDYAEDFKTHYSREILSRKMQDFGYKIESMEYIFMSEMVMLLRKKD